MMQRQKERGERGGGGGEEYLVVIFLNVSILAGQVAYPVHHDPPDQVVYQRSEINQSIFYFMSVHIEVILDKNKNI